MVYFIFSFLSNFAINSAALKAFCRARHHVVTFQRAPKSDRHSAAAYIATITAQP